MFQNVFIAAVAVTGESISLHRAKELLGTVAATPEGTELPANGRDSTRREGVYDLLKKYMLVAVANDVCDISGLGNWKRTNLV